MARHRPDWSIGISHWGSHEPRLWLKAARPLHSLIQYSSRFPLRRYERQEETNLVEFFHPAYTWTRKILGGNIRGIVEANEKNLGRFMIHFGKPDIIHAHVAYPAGYIARRLSEKYDIPYVVTEHMSPFPLPSFRRRVKKYLLPPLKDAQAVLSVGDNLTEALKKYGVPAITLANFVDTDRFIPGAARHNETPVIFALGRLVEQKGFDQLLAAMATLADKPWRLRIGGGGPLASRLKRQMEQLGLGERVKFTGELEQDQVVREMQSCDFFILSSRHESFAVVLAEAMSCGKPVVYTYCGGITDTLPQTVGIGSVLNGLAHAIAAMLTTYPSYDPVQIRQHVADHYSVQAVAPRLEEIYKAVAGSQL